jgi:hypothetical protein
MVALLALIGLVVLVLIIVEFLGFTIQAIAWVLLVVVLLLGAYRLIRGEKLW